MQNLDLPVLQYREQILATVARSSVTIITAETGAGKSTQVPRFLVEAGYRVVVTEPRRLAARTVAARVAEEMGTRLGGRVGYRTAEDRCDSAETQVLFCTDGLQLVRELAGVGGTGWRKILVLDEVHEWNLNMEVLIAWTKSRLAAGNDLKVVLMSATIEAEKLASFFGGATVISVPGRLFPVEMRASNAESLVSDAAALAKAERNVLVFQPGKREIAETIEKLARELGGRALVLPLHGELTPDEQRLCFDSPPVGTAKVVVSTNVAQTSVTIPYIDAVVDSGVERRVELVDGIEGLYILPISQADCKQRAGRAGRCQPGIYVLCSELNVEDRSAFPVAEILRSRLDQVVLRLAVQGFDAAGLEFFHQPDHTVIIEAKRSLVALGAMTAEGQVTPLGRRMSRFSVSVQFARMLIEAERLGVVEQVAIIAACLEAGDIRSKPEDKDDIPAWRALTKETKSDLLALLDVFNAGKAMPVAAGKSKAQTLRDAGIFAKAFYRAEEIRKKLLEAIGAHLRSTAKKFASAEVERQAVLFACVAGMVDHLYSGGYGFYGSRQLDRQSVVSGNHQWIVGLPKDIQFVTRFGNKKTLHLVSMTTAVEPAWLMEVAPQLVSTRAGFNPRYDAAQDVVVSSTQTLFNGQAVRSEEIADEQHPEATTVFARWLAGQLSAPGSILDEVMTANAARQKRAYDLNRLAGRTVFQVFYRFEIEEWYKKALNGARRLAEIREQQALRLPALDQELVASVLRERPETIELVGRQVAVTYTSFDPQVILPAEAVSDGSWRNLPDYLKLPDGQLVEVVVRFGLWTTYSGSVLRELKEQVRSHLDRERQERLRYSFPSPSMPSVRDEDKVLPQKIVARPAVVKPPVKLSQAELQTGMAGLLAKFGKR